ncbi:hypothetical protein HYC85_022240 [Camellia sinensis]|uniref:NADH dehydrogenase [ubiquinone] 1 alpha subcomplex subunit 1 n=1 Tax=Camellia sinensis TaxID=4442 RepID=A0A7J7GJV4_CAMSI|nr:hypothetical protein HYC85_022240 [Camellia sinensis]
MGLQWLEAALPLGIIAGMLCIMGNAQYYIHKVAHGRIESLCVFASKSIASSCSYFVVVVVVVDLKITAEARRQRCVGRRYGETGQEAHREVCFVPKLVPTSGRDGFSDQIRIMPFPALIQFVDRLNGNSFSMDS